MDAAIRHNWNLYLLPGTYVLSQIGRITYGKLTVIAFRARLRADQHLIAFARHQVKFKSLSDLEILLTYAWYVRDHICHENSSVIYSGWDFILVR